MRYLALAALLLLAAAWSWEGHDGQDGRWRLPVVPAGSDWRGVLAVQWPELCGSAVDADVTRLLRMSGDRRDVRVAGFGTTLAPMGAGQVEGEPGNSEGTGKPEARLGEGVLDENPYLEPALEYYGVEWARDSLIIVRFRESSNILEPCVVGLSGERGPYQFMSSTWATTPYAHLDPCDLEAATWATAWKVKQPGGKEAWAATWPR